MRFHTPPDVPLVAFICIDKKLPGKGMETGLAALGYRAVGFSKKVIIDATRQLPAEGGPKSWPAANRSALEALAPDAFPLIDTQLEGILAPWMADAGRRTA